MTAMGAEPAFVELLEAYRAGESSAREELVERYLPLVRSVARRYAGRGEPLEDLVQVGCVGLVLAIERFEVERGVQFSTYAVPTIVGEIQRHFRDRTWMLRVPRRTKELGMRLARTADTMTADLGRSPTIAELAEAADLDDDEVVEALESYHAYAPRSLSQPLGVGGAETLEDVVGTVEPEYERVEDGAFVEAGLEELDDRERTIVELRFYEGLTQSEIAARVGISQMHVSRLLRRALGVMHGRLDERGDGEAAP
jgi:RNA polymerase sigma-B factor